MRKKLILLGIVLAVVIAYVQLDLGQYLTLASLKSRQAELAAIYETHRFATIALYMVAYIAGCALSIPGAATLLTLAGGAVFGLGFGTLLVSFASTIGATLAFLASRFLFREAVQARFGARIEAFDKGVKREGAFYVFTLRLVPVVPFFMVNLVMGLTALRTVTFYWVSQIGMLPGTLAYVNAGTQLAKIESLRGILSPQILLSFAVVGIIPLLSRKIVTMVKSRRVLRRFPRPRKFDYNMIVIGGGSAGLVSAYIAAAVKARVVLIEKHRMGGDCLNTGCVPSKALIRSAKILSYIRRAGEFGLGKGAPIEVAVDFARIMERVERVISKVEPHDSVERYTSLGVECIRGEARLKSPYSVEVNGRTLTARGIVLATGATPVMPPIPGLDRIKPFTSDTIWSLRNLPPRLLVLGGGAIGCELAQCFARFGSKVTLVEKSDRILFREDPDVSELVVSRFQAEGMRILTGHEAREVRIDRDGRKRLLVRKTNGGEEEIEFDEILLALGRRANTRGFGLEELGVELAPNGAISTDGFLKTNFPSIFACGDVVGPYQFTHVAAHQAWFVAVNSLFSGIKSFRADYRVIPWATFTDPEVGRVGLNETEARERGVQFEVTTYDIGDLDRAIADEVDHGWVKVLTAPGKDRILGATIVGHRAGDLISEFVTAMKHGLGMNKILSTIHIYPTLTEMNKYAAGNWKRAHAPERALRYLEKFHTWRRGTP